jgi:hypothetical protein
MGVWTALLDGFTVLEAHWKLVLGVTGMICLGYVLLFALPRNLPAENKKDTGRSLLPVIFFACMVILRLAFLRDIFVPPYFDSVEHYRITVQLAAALESSTLVETLPAVTPVYYHLGFHFLASLLAIGLRADPMDVILVLGQVILAAIPVPVYFLVRQDTASDEAAFFAMLLAGFGWYMPGFAVNWGKYPALAGLLTLEIALGIAYFTIKLNRRHPRRLEKMFLLCLLVLSTGLSTLFHTRAFIIIAIAMASWFVAGRTQAARRLFQYLLLGLFLGVILAFRLFPQTELQTKLALEPYLGLGLWVTLIVFALCPFALLHFRQGFYFSILLIFGSFFALFIPAGIRSPGLENQTLLDRPFVEMALYLPLSILGGLGLAGLIKSLNGIHSMPEASRLYVRVATAVLLLVFTMFLMENYNFFPEDCCNFVRYDDTIVLDWLDRNLPADARVLVAGTALNVLPTGPSPGLVGTDAGIWIPNLTDRPIALAPFDSDFRAGSTLEALCQMKIDYIYVGSAVQKFNPAHLDERREWYEKILFLPHAQLYRLKGCTK